MEFDSDQAFYLNELRPLLAGIVIGFVQDEQGFYGLQIQVGDTIYHVWFSRDAEQNGPGAAIVEEMEWEDENE